MSEVDFGGFSYIWLLVLLGSQRGIADAVKQLKNVNTQTSKAVKT